MDVLRAQLFNPSGVFLTETEKGFIASFGTPEKPVALDEFLEFWNSLAQNERHHYIMSYAFDVYRK